jgi:hypothetical protein
MFAGETMIWPQISDGGAAAIVMVIAAIGMAIVELGAMLAFFGNALLLGVAASAWIPFFGTKGQGFGHWFGRPLFMILSIFAVAAIYVAGGFGVVMVDQNRDDLRWMTQCGFLGLFLSIGGSAITLLTVLVTRVRHIWGIKPDPASKAHRLTRGLTWLLLGAGSGCLLAAVVGVALAPDATLSRWVMALGVATSIALAMVIADAMGIDFLQEKPSPKPSQWFLWFGGEFVLWMGIFGLAFSVILITALIASKLFGFWSSLLLVLVLGPSVGLLRLAKVDGLLRRTEPEQES